MNRLTVETLLFFAFPGVVDNSLYLLLHTLHGARTAIGTFLSETKANAPARPKLDDSFIVSLQAHSRPQDSSIHLSVEIIRIGVLSDELRNLDTGNEILVRLGHEVVVASL